MQVDELAGKPVGERIRIIRDRRGMTRPVVAGLVGKSPDWLKKIESGERLPPRLPMLIQLADILGVGNVAELTGDDPVAIGFPRKEAHPAVPAIREAIEETHLAIDTRARPDLAALQQLLDRAWRIWHTSATPRADVGRILPELIRDGRRAARIFEGQERRQANLVLVGAYALAEQVLAWVSDSALLWMTADRCMSAAEQADHPEALAGAAWVVGNVWRNGREDEALRLADDAVRILTPYLDSGSDDLRALWGACQLHGSITAARLGREGDALHRLDQAEAMSTRLPTAYAHAWTLFGRANTELTGVSVSVDLRKGGTALDKAGAVDPDVIPSVDRRARLWLETARAYAQQGEHTSALHVLQRAASVSEESMRCHPLARNISGQLIVSGGKLIEREARGLAQRLGVLAGS
ncbi:helix-turn-helix domain-containing protein [Glycomyces buryatensis]|uniref:Helix-turn-helix transcriptional regulator n=1 Tax=Glycomyces buryatensis TaxID=2570927 RepID=A0A4S8QFQ7_9ACTN|nr:helix-turn-helix transcriptional regulator [Glycomyces buryatensis]THV43463.1 helix-turn-helix transcriptional regulator [Glycomyces buryatensis]